MAMTFNSLEDLFVLGLRNILDAERQITDALPKMIDAASLPYLKQKFNDHLQQTKDQIARLEKIFALLKLEPQAFHSEGIAGLIKEGELFVNAEGHPAVIDAGLIAAAQKIEHYEISAYGTLRTFARTLARKDIAELLQSTLREEAKTDELLTQVAEASVNKRAA